MTDRIQPNEAECKLAKRQIDNYLRKHANGRGDLDDLASGAWEAWLTEGKNTPATYAERELLNVSRTEKRRKTFADVSIIDATGAGDGREDVMVTALDTPAHAAPAVWRRRYLPGEELELWAAVRFECLYQFKDRVDVEWDPRWERHIRTLPDPDDDLREAHDVHAQLRAAMLRAVEFVQRPRNRPVALGLNWWVSEHIEPLTRHAFMDEREAEDKHSLAWWQHRSPRYRLVASWDGRKFAELPARSDGRGDRALDAAEYAIVWLLGGGWPEGLTIPPKGLTPSEVIQSEARTFRNAIDEVGRDLLRGPG